MKSYFKRLLKSKGGLDMKRVLPITSLVVVGMGASAAMWLSSKPNRLKAESVLRDWKRKIKPSPFDKSETLPIEKGGHPHPHDLEDNNMVSEGAMYSVQFFNEKMQ
jgi:hypothetical protein